MSTTSTTVALSAYIQQTCCYKNLVFLAYENIGQITSSTVCNILVVAVIVRHSFVFAIWCYTQLPVPCSANSVEYLSIKMFFCNFAHECCILLLICLCLVVFFTVL